VDVSTVGKAAATVRRPSTKMKNGWS